MIPMTYLPQILALTLTIGGFTNWIGSSIHRISIALDYLFNPNIYVFLDNYIQPFPARSLCLNSVHSATVVIAYNADTLVFFPHMSSQHYSEISEENRSKKLPILSLEIVNLKSEVIFDLTDFIVKVRYIETTDSGCPTISEIISAWSIGSMIVLDRDRFSVRYITEDGDTVLTTLDDSNKSEKESSVEDVIIEDVSGQEIQSDDISIEELEEERCVDSVD